MPDRLVNGLSHQDREYASRPNLPFLVSRPSLNDLESDMLTVFFIWPKSSPKCFQGTIVCIITVPKNK